MNNASPEKKNSILKTLAIAGFVAIIIVIAWLSIQLVSVLPNAFSSLASLAEGVNQYQQSTIEPEPAVPLVVTSNTTLLNTGGVVDISWNTAKANGTYAFNYECTEGVAVDLISVNGNQSIECGTNYNIGDVDSAKLAIDSVKNRYADVTYSVSFMETDSDTPRATGDATITVVNSEISNITFTEDSIESTEEEIITDEETAIDEILALEEDEVVTPSPTEPEVTNPTTPATPVFEQEFVYTVPVSDPSGRTDLATRYLLSGAIENNTFVPSLIDRDETGAIQFEVKNIGTKTSEEWDFTVSLPGGGTYTASDQAPLKPNERAVLTIGFQAAGENSHTFEVSVSSPTDQNRNNNSFRNLVAFF